MRGSFEMTVRLANCNYCPVGGDDSTLFADPPHSILMIRLPQGTGYHTELFIVDILPCMSDLSRQQVVLVPGGVHTMVRLRFADSML